MATVAVVGRRLRARRQRLLLALIVIVVGLGVVACERRPPWPQRGAPSPDDLAARLRALHRSAICAFVEV